MQSSVGIRVGNVKYNSILVTVTRSILWSENGND